MSYTKTTLLPGENIFYQTKPHYIVLIKFAIWPALALFSFKYNSIFIGYFFLLMGIINFIQSLIYYFCSEYVITNKRILAKTGFIQRRSLEIFIDRIEGVYIKQSVIGRILHFGKVVVAGIGGTKNPFSYIPNPLKFRNMVQKKNR